METANNHWGGDSPISQPPAACAGSSRDTACELSPGLAWAFAFDNAVLSDLSTLLNPPPTPTPL